MGWVGPTPNWKCLKFIGLLPLDPISFWILPSCQDNKGHTNLSSSVPITSVLVTLLAGTATQHEKSHLFGFRSLKISVFHVREFLDDLHEEVRRKDAEKNAQVTYWSETKKSGVVLLTNKRIWKPFFALAVAVPGQVNNKAFDGNFYRTRVRSLAMLVTNSLTNFCLVNLIDVPSRVRLKTCWGCCCWWGSCWQQFVVDFKLRFGKKLNFCSDFEHKVWSRFWRWSLGKIWSWSLGSFLLLMFCRGYEVESWWDSEARFGQDFEA